MYLVSQLQKEALHNSIVSALPLSLGSFSFGQEIPRCGARMWIVIITVTRHWSLILIYVSIAYVSYVS
jgi:hypothetical protein